jgi:Rrf2 family nitric oxide-sensitive transcriptional repressor
MYVAVDKDRPATIAAIAKTYRISETHLMKVVNQLGIAGDIATTRGRKGGIRLAKAPDSINLGSIIRRTEADMELVPCFGDAENCAIEDVCRLRTVLAEALKAFLAVLDQYTLADLVSPRHRLAGLLGIKPSSPPSPGSNIEPVL